MGGSLSLGGRDESILRHLILAGSFSYSYRKIEMTDDRLMDIALELSRVIVNQIYEDFPTVTTIGVRPETILRYFKKVLEEK